jgi:hypothetical protein
MKKILIILLFPFSVFAQSKTVLKDSVNKYMEIGDLYSESHISLPDSITTYYYSKALYYQGKIDSIEKVESKIFWKKEFLKKKEELELKYKIKLP